MTFFARTTTAVAVATVFVASHVQALNIKLEGINYDLRQGPDWDKKNKCKPEAVVKKELKLLSALTPSVRTYALADCSIQPILKATKELDLTIWLGIWVGEKPQVFKKELDVLQKLIKQELIDYHVVGINVGSEAIYRQDVEVEEAIANYVKVKSMLKEAGLKTPVSITDVQLEKYPEIIKAVDVVTVNQFPFWNDVLVENATNDLYESMQGLIKAAGDKPVIITETGWSSLGKNENSSDASAASAAKYLNDFVLMAEKEKWKYYYFAGFDATYKKKSEDDKNTVEQGFGLFDKNKRLKREIAQLSIEGAIGAGPADPLPESALSGPNNTDIESIGTTIDSHYSTTLFMLALTTFLVVIA